MKDSDYKYLRICERLYLVVRPPKTGSRLHYIRESYSSNMIILLDENWLDHTGAARAA